MKNAVTTPVAYLSVMITVDQMIYLGLVEVTSLENQENFLAGTGTRFIDWALLTEQRRSELTFVIQSRDNE